MEIKHYSSRSSKESFPFDRMQVGTKKVFRQQKGVENPSKNHFWKIQKNSLNSAFIREGGYWREGNNSSVCGWI